MKVQIFRINIEHNRQKKIRENCVPACVLTTHVKRNIRILSGDTRARKEIYVQNDKYTYQYMIKVYMNRPAQELLLPEKR